MANGNCILVCEFGTKAQLLIRLVPKIRFVEVRSLDMTQANESDR